jgi:hypothetical protein
MAIIDPGCMELLALDTLETHWCQALDDAEQTLAGLSRSSRLLRIPAVELRERVEELRRERHQTELELEELARTTHLPIQRRLERPAREAGERPSSR